MNTSTSKALEIAALSAMYGAPVTHSPVARNRWSRVLSEAWVRLRSRSPRSTVADSAVEWSIRGL
jgi:hypothetical protein